MNKIHYKKIALAITLVLACGNIALAEETSVTTDAVSYTHLTLPTNREV